MLYYDPTLPGGGDLRLDGDESQERRGRALTAMAASSYPGAPGTVALLADTLGPTAAADAAADIRARVQAALLQHGLGDISPDVVISTYNRGLAARVSLSL